MATTADVIGSRLAEALERRMGENVVRIAAAYDADYRERAPRGQEGPASGAAHGIPRTSARLNDALVARPDQLGPLSWTIHLEVDDVRAPHGKYIDQPVAEIVPVNAKALRWFGYRTGQAIFAQRVVPSREHEGWWDRWTGRLDEVTAEAWDQGG